VRVMARVHEDEFSGVVEALFLSLASTRLHSPPPTNTHSHPSVRLYYCWPDIYIEDALSDIHLLNIRKPSIETPFGHELWSLFSRLDHLISLIITLSDSSDAQSQLQILLDQLPCLSSLGSCRKSRAPVNMFNNLTYFAYQMTWNILSQMFLLENNVLNYVVHH
jgi:hypothetical protein